MTRHFKKIQTSFNKASKSYDHVARVQKDAAKFLVSKLLKHQNSEPQSVLDLGTGTGYIPELLLPKFKQSFFYLNDAADQMLKECRVKFAKSTNIYYIPGDMLKLNHNIYNWVISNFAFQWLSDLQFALKFFHSKASDIFAFSTLLDGTFEEWENIINQYQFINTFNYPKAEDLIDLCKRLKNHEQIFEFWLMDIPIVFDSPKEFMHYLKLLGASASGNQINLCNLRRLHRAKHKDLTITYKIFFGIFRKVS